MNTKRRTQTGPARARDSAGRAVGCARRRRRPRRYAVLTGDVAGSSAAGGKGPSALPALMERAFARVAAALPGVPHGRFDVYRGDSFQCVLRDPRLALRAALILRCSLRSRSRPHSRRPALDARIAVGIGTVSYLPSADTRISTGQGDAFLRSGGLLDEMNRADDRIRFDTPWAEVREELDAEAALLDAIVRCWSARQSEAICSMLAPEVPSRPGRRHRPPSVAKPPTQMEVAARLGISQPALHKMLRLSGYFAVEKLLRIHERRIGELLTGRSGRS